MQKIALPAPLAPRPARRSVAGELAGDLNGFASFAICRLAFIRRFALSINFIHASVPGNDKISQFQNFFPALG